MGRPAFEPQRVLAGRYRLERRLGGGGMGAIWRAEHLSLEAPVAVKLIDRIDEIWKATGGPEKTRVQ